MTNETVGIIMMVGMLLLSIALTRDTKLKKKDSLK